MKVINFLRVHSFWAQNIGILLIRIGIGLIFIKHGYGKLLGGTKTWLWLGSQMQHFGITFLPVMWGFLAASTEFFGGCSLVFGYMTRLFSFFLVCVMIVAVVMHHAQGDAWNQISHPLSLLIVFIGVCFAGAGKLSLDYYLSRK